MLRMVYRDAVDTVPVGVPGERVVSVQRSGGFHVSTDRVERPLSVPDELVRQIESELLADRLVVVDGPDRVDYHELSVACRRPELAVHDTRVVVAGQPPFAVELQPVEVKQVVEIALGGESVQVTRRNEDHVVGVVAG